MSKMFRDDKTNRDFQNLYNYSDISNLVCLHTKYRAGLNCTLPLLKSQVSPSMHTAVLCFITRVTLHQHKILKTHLGEFGGKADSTYQADFVLLNVSGMPLYDANTFSPSCAPAQLTTAFLLL